MRISVDMTDRNYGGYTAKEFDIDLSRNRSEILVEISYRHKTAQQGGQLRLQPDIARWLGHALIAAADDESRKTKLKLTVSDGG